MRGWSHAGRWGLLAGVALTAVACTDHDPAGAAGAAAAEATPRAGEGELTVSAAANLSFAIRDLARRFEAETGLRLAINLAATGQLTHQIEQGAPVDLFLAADTEHVALLEAAGLTVEGSRSVYAVGRLAIWVRAERDGEVRDLRGLLAPEVKRIAIANPQHAPYGVAARRALQRLELWKAVQPKLVLGENVRQALQYAESGNVDAGLIPVSLAEQAGGRWHRVPAELHPPLEQALVIIRSSAQRPAAERLRRFVLTGAGREILTAHGYELPPLEVAP